MDLQSVYNEDLLRGNNKTILEKEKGAIFNRDRGANI